jgi:hypothetical protein
MQMKQMPMKLRIPYEQWSLPSRCRTMRPSWFLDEDAVMVGVVEPEEAQVAYRVQAKPLPLDPDRGRDYVIRAFEDKLWWPLPYPGGPSLSPVEFKMLAASGIPLPVLAIDPSISPPLSRWPYTLFEEQSVRRVGDSDQGQRWVWANRNAAGARVRA